MKFSSGLSTVCFRAGSYIPTGSELLAVDILRTSEVQILAPRNNAGTKEHNASNMGRPPDVRCLCWL
jgi:hypothetical protein